METRVGQHCWSSRVIFEPLSLFLDGDKTVPYPAMHGWNLTDWKELWEEICEALSWRSGNATANILVWLKIFKSFIKSLKEVLKFQDFGLQKFSCDSDISTAQSLISKNRVSRFAEEGTHDGEWKFVCEE